MRAEYNSVLSTPIEAYIGKTQISADIGRSLVSNNVRVPPLLRQRHTAALGLLY